jgi:hypothetical protein
MLNREFVEHKHVLSPQKKSRFLLLGSCILSAFRLLLLSNTQLRVMKKQEVRAVAAVDSGLLAFD